MKKILLIDDDQTLGKVMTSLLKTEGYELIVQENSAQVDDVIAQNAPKLIILDYYLPDKSGAEVALHLKMQQRTKNIPIIMISSSYGVESTAKKIGVDAFLPKPFDIDKLTSLIHSFIV